MIKKKEYKYKKKWLEYISSHKNTIEKVEVYLTKDKDTIYQQYKFYKNKVLDSTKSTFYILEFNKRGENEYYGRVYFHNKDDYEFKSPIIEKNLGLAFLHSKRDTTKVWDFESKNKDYVEFEYTHTNDTLIGMLYETRLLDTIINGEKMIRILETGIPIDNMPKTDNPFIEVFDLDENKYVR
ncbi:hypothetical protein [Psychroserpens damuponensis]|uniref:hypothetical protein n=1 Tax=Psychroserpens damuponensis TaxID=943936 RepID=UPI0013793080|nr:hypothetical protein [Psychroserpens damuponensis]